MTDRLRSCKQSPDGRHVFTLETLTCCWCGLDEATVFHQAPPREPAEPIDLQRLRWADGHLGAVGGE